MNHSPSFTTDSKLDREIKDAVVYDTFVLVNFSFVDKRKCLEKEKKLIRERLVKLKNPANDEKLVFASCYPVFKMFMFQFNLVLI